MGMGLVGRRVDIMAAHKEPFYLLPVSPISVAKLKSKLLTKTSLRHVSVVF